MKIYELFSFFVKKLLQNHVKQTLTKNSVFKFSIKKVHQILNTAGFVQYNRLMLCRSMSVLNYVPRVPLGPTSYRPTCLTCPSALRAFLPLLFMCLLFLRAFLFFTCIVCLHFLHALRVFSFTCLTCPHLFIRLMCFYILIASSL